MDINYLLLFLVSIDKSTGDVVKHVVQIAVDSRNGKNKAKHPYVFWNQLLGKGDGCIQTNHPDCIEHDKQDKVNAKCRANQDTMEQGRRARSHVGNCKWFELQTKPI